MELTKEEILMKSMVDMERIIFLMLLKLGGRIEIDDKDYECANFDEYTLDHYYDGCHQVNVFEMKKLKTDKK